MGAVISIRRDTQFVVETCYKCGVEFAVVSDLQKHWREQGKAVTFYCPHGHPQAYTESQVERVRRELQSQIDEAKRSEEWWKVRNAEKDRRLSAAKGQMTKLRKRVGEGVCPCCNRTFKQLAAHMQHKHPEFKRPDGDLGTAEPRNG